MIGFLLRLSIVRDKLKELLLLLIFCSVKPQNGTVFRERQKFCVHGIIGARQSGASNEHEYQTQFS